MRLEVSQPHKRTPRNVHRLTKTTKPYSFPWTSLSCSLSSVCTSRQPHTRVTPNCYLYPSSILKYKRRSAESSRVLNLIAFSVLLVLSLAGAIGLSVRAASRNGKGLCQDPDSENPSKCREAAAALAVTWISVMIGAPSAALVPHLVDLTTHR